ncbi:protein kinase [Glonium stellatum]|uniref:non-specific serine/threonine protein kinase n=1 Tax=Glonium stellatum TaxID=574774 RepID=A0A8E2EXL8_9PEZI|nr:protein kinase [Glonium stellatum]
MATSPHSPLRKFPTSGFVVLDATKKIEEEDVPSYVPEDYYPVYIGEVFRSRYQVVTKLGFGVNSTVWLCRDLREHRYLTLKMRVRTKEHDLVDLHSDREITINEHLKSNSIEHLGKDIVRRVLDSFEIASPNGNHKCMLYQPLGMSFTDYLRLLPQNRFPKDLAQRSVQLLLIALDYLHQCHIVHTDISPNNVLQKIEDDSIISQIEKGELERPIARKVLSDRTIYKSRPMPLSTGPPVLCDLGEARVGTQKHRGDIMPGIYRAPEVILGMDWDSKVDIWAIGVMTWDLLEGGHLFFARKNRILDDEQHLAEMVSLLGPPPPEFLKRSEKCYQYWDNQGNWKGSVPIPDQSFEIREQWLHGEDRALFLQFLRRMLCWMPEERPVAEELAFDEFLMQPHATAFSGTSTETLT